MGATVRFPLRRSPGTLLVRPVSSDMAGEFLAGEIVAGIRRRAAERGLVPRRVMLDVLFGLVAELAGDRDDACRPAELADMVRLAAEETAAG